MTPQAVNAYYNPTTNEICFPAAILQRSAEDAEKFNVRAKGLIAQFDAIEVLPCSLRLKNV